MISILPDDMMGNLTKEQLLEVATIYRDAVKECFDGLFILTKDCDDATVTKAVNIMTFVGYNADFRGLLHYTEQKQLMGRGEICPQNQLPH